MQVAEGLVDRKGDGGAHVTGFSQANSMQESPAITHLLTNPRIFPKVVDILGTNVSMYHCPCIVTPGLGQEPPSVHTQSAVACDIYAFCSSDRLILFTVRTTRPSRRSGTIRTVEWISCIL